MVEANPGNIIGGSKRHLLEESGSWHLIDNQQLNEGHPPCPRSLHASVALDNDFYIFGGYDGTNRRNDFFKFNFDSQQWTELLPVDNPPPSARDRHTAVVNSRHIYIFGGYDGFNRVDDFHKFSIDLNKW